MPVRKLLYSVIKDPQTSDNHVKWRCSANMVQRTVIVDRETADTDFLEQSKFTLLWCRICIQYLLRERPPPPGQNLLWQLWKSVEVGVSCRDVSIGIVRDRRLRFHVDWSPRLLHHFWKLWASYIVALGLETYYFQNDKATCRVARATIVRMVSSTALDCAEIGYNLPH